jgi:hypothetical protein
MLYGTGIPILYPIALVSYLILYFLEKTLLFYYYKRPPMYDDKLSRSALDILPFAGLFHAAVSYWMLSNN